MHSTIATKESINTHFDEQEYLISAGKIAKALLLDFYEENDVRYLDIELFYEMKKA